MGLVQQASKLAKTTEEDRNRYVDFLRALAITAVVTGHWLVIDIQLQDGVPEGINALTEASWTHWGTWLFQVIPLFFLVGGYANAVSWRRHEENGDGWASWLSRRSLRLLWPTAIFVAVGLMVVPIAALTDLPEDVLSQAGWAVTIILWFLAVYLGVAVLTPLTIRAHDAWGLWFVAGLCALVAANDAIRFVGGIEVFSYLNYALVWILFHQIGYAWKDGLLPDAAPSFGLAALFAATLVALVVWGPYPVSMVGVPGSEIQNTGPPSLALLFLGLAQIGVAMSLRQPAKRMLQAPRVWAAVVGGNLVAMSVFLWHVVPVAVLAAILSAVGTTLPGETGSLPWLLLRPVWILLLAVLLVPLVLLVGKVERPPNSLESWIQDHGRLSLPMGLVGVGLASAGLARLTLEGFWAGGPALIPVFGALAFFGGALLAIGSGGDSPKGEATGT